jgi:AcrR family transcriptional regulator
MEPAKKPKVARSFRGVSAETRKHERREKLMEAAFTLFGTTGFHGVTVREICAEAKLTERYFYESFPNLEVLFLAVHGKLYLELKQAMFRAVLASPRVPTLMGEAALILFFTYISEDTRRFRILMMDALNLGGSVGTQAEVATNEFVELTRSFLVGLFPTGEAELGLDGGYIAQGMIGMAMSLSRRWASEGFKMPVALVLRNALAFYRGLLAYEKEARAQLVARAEPEQP